MRYLNAGLMGAVAGAIAGAIVGTPLMLWGPGANDPLAVLWVFLGALVTAPAGIVVGLLLARGSRTGRFAAGARAGPAILGALVTAGAALAMFREEVLDEWFNLPVFGAMGAAAGLLTSSLLRPRPPRPRRSAERGRSQETSTRTP